ncbi:hypothetical protein K504DRAFT_375752 [Pleomassaria siparia CBS 279.74]|uniref:Uncharacterized protein n=1 Tax=Pleomassaria siparia CBS 279.74 TaxID=1314801 RepID=A0A6G1KDA2_9PLEO|nr:hypothetical protein K504DRAFT_375752 [Pleomassaria siparia CBS 279.74]
MATTVGTSGSGEPDMALVAELLEEISRRPPALGAMKLLVELYISVGWLDAAMEYANTLKRLSPDDAEVTGFLQLLEKKPEPPTSTPAASSPVPRKPVPTTMQLSENMIAARDDFSQGYKSLRIRAKTFFNDMLHLQALQKKQGLAQTKTSLRVEAIVEGRSAAMKEKMGSAPGSIRSVTRTIQANPEMATGLAIADLEDVMRWVRKPHGIPSGADDDTVRDALVERARGLEIILPDKLKIHCELALMHVEHENLDRNYVNDETMLGDMVKDIPRDNFYVTEDNYAWDMEELAQAITANGGVMRNPLSKIMFTPKDIRGIVTHEHGKVLGILQMEQHEMAKGVRPTTIEKMEELARILLEDQSADSLPSRHAVDEFSAYCATLPELEQKVLDGLRCPAKDSHTLQSYDFTVGEAVRDAKGNRVCFHKTGDFILQAAAHLRNNQGKPPDTNTCVVM